MPKADVVVQDVQPPVTLDRERRHRLRRILLRHVRRERRRLAAFRPDLLRQCLGTRGVAVDQHHLRTLAREHDGSGRTVADALATRRRAGDNRDLSRQTCAHRPALPYSTPQVRSMCFRLLRSVQAPVKYALLFTFDERDRLDIHVPTAPHYSIQEALSICRRHVA